MPCFYNLDRSRKKWILPDSSLRSKLATIEAKDTQIIIESEGILKPKIESAFISEVSGKVTHIGQNFYPGSYFEEGETLFEIDPLNYVERLKAAEFQLAQAKLYFAEQTALAEQAKADWEKV